MKLKIAGCVVVSTVMPHTIPAEANARPSVGASLINELERLDHVRLPDGAVGYAVVRNNEAIGLMLGADICSSTHLGLVCHVDDDRSFIIIDTHDANYRFSAQTGEVEITIPNAKVGTQKADTMTYDHAAVELKMAIMNRDNGTLIIQSGATAIIGKNSYSMKNMTLKVDVV